MNLILSSLSLLGLSIIYVSRYKIEKINTWFVSASTLIILSFISIALGGTNAILYLNLLILLIGSYQYYISDKKKQYNYLIAVWLVIIVTALLITKHESYQYIFNWDDFSHWARSVKLLYLSGEFGSYYKDLILFPNYGPSSAVWHILFQDGQTIDERILYFSQLILIVSILLMIYGIIDNKIPETRHRIIVSAILLALCNTITPYGHNLQVDSIIGMGFSAAFLMYNYTYGDVKKKNIYTIIMLTPLIMSKLTGMFSAVQFALLSIIVSEYRDVSHIIRTVLITLISSLGILIWLFGFVGLGVELKTSDIVLSANIIDRIIWQYEIFYDFFINKFIYLSINKSHVILYGLTLYSIYLSIKKNDSKPFKMVFVSFASYLIFLFLAYSFYFNGGFGGGEAETLGSMNRYFSVQLYFLVPILIIETVSQESKYLELDLFLLLLIVGSFYFPAIFVVIPMALVFSYLISTVITENIAEYFYYTGIAIILIIVGYYHSVFYNKIIPSDSYMNNMARLKDIGNVLRNNKTVNTIVVWDDYSVYERLAMQYYTDYMNIKYEVIGGDEYNRMMSHNNYLEGIRIIVR